MKRLAVRVLALVMACGTFPAPMWSGESPLVDTKATTTGSPVTADQIQNLPASARSFDDVIRAVPQVAEHKTAPNDSINWDGISGPISEVQVTSPFSRQYLENIRVQREWPGEASGTNGAILATGRVGREQAAVLYSPYGAALDAFFKSEIYEEGGERLNDALDMACFTTVGKMTTAGKSQVMSGKQTASGKQKLRLVDPFETRGLTSTQSVINDLGYPALAEGARYETPLFGYPNTYKYTPRYGVNYRYDQPDGPRENQNDAMPFRPLNLHMKPGGGMQQLDPPATDFGRQALEGGATVEEPGKVAVLDLDIVSNPNTMPKGAKEQMATWRDDSPPAVSGVSETRTDEAGRPKRPHASAVPSGEKASSASNEAAPVTVDLGPNSAALVDGAGSRTTIDLRADGSVVRTVADAADQVVEQVKMAEPPKTPVKVKDQRTFVSMRNPDGTLTTVEKPATGPSIRTVTDAEGKVLSRNPVEVPPPTVPKPRDPELASATDANGNTIRVVRQPDGTRRMTVTDPSGKVLADGPVVPPQPTKVPPRTPGQWSASTTDANGTTTTITGQPGGPTTRTVTDRGGKVLEQGQVTPPPPSVPKKPKKEPGGWTASATDINGTTTTIRGQPDGSRTRTVTAPDGTVLEDGPMTPPPPTVPKKPARAPGEWSADATNPDGSTTTIRGKPDGSKTRTVTDANGNVIESGPVTPEPPTKVPPRKPGHTSASTTDADGNTVTYDKPPGGPNTRTITDPDGNVVDRTTVEPPPPTIPKTPPRTPGHWSASGVDQDGNTTTVVGKPDGSKTRTVTDRNGNTISSGPVTDPEPTLPRPKGSTAVSATDPQGNTVAITRQPDGQQVMAVTSPQGDVIAQGPLAVPPKAQMAADQAAGQAAAVTPAVDATQAPSYNWSKFAQDTWSLTDNLTLKAGLRYDLQKSSSDQGAGANDPVTGASGMNLSDLYAPRIGLIYDWTKEGRNKVYAHWGRFYESIPMDVNTRSFGGDVQYESWWDWYAAPIWERMPFRNPSDLGAPQRTADFPTWGTDFPLRQTDGVPSGVTLVAPGTKSRLTDRFVVWDQALKDLELLKYWDDGEATDDDDDYDDEFGPPPPYLRQVLKAMKTSENGFAPYIESGIRINGMNYTNLGTYRDGHHPILDRPRTPQHIFGNPVTAPFGQGTFNPNIHSTVDLRRFNNFVPERVGVLPFGCTAAQKRELLDVLDNMWDSDLPYRTKLWLDEFIVWVWSQDPPNDPLYQASEKAVKAQQGRETRDERQRHQQNLQALGAGPLGGGGAGMMSDAALRGPSHGKNEPKALDQWGLRAVGLDTAWAIEDGSKPNVVVAVIDSGLDLTHPDGPQHLWTNEGEVPNNGIDDEGDGFIDDVHGWNFINESHDLTDHKGHGTLVTGIIAAKRNNGIGIAGINPGARIMTLKVANEEGKASSLAVYRAVHFAVDHGARVINISYGEKGVSRLMQAAINYAHARGAVIVVSAGNQAGDAAQHTPGSARRALTVASVDMDGTHSALSNAGVNVAITAPGEQIYSLHSKDAEWEGASLERERLYRPASGTSFSAPIVAATASLIMAKTPGLPNRLVEDLLINSTSLSAPAWEPGMGWGVLNASKALTLKLDELVTVLPTEVVVTKEKKAVRTVDVFGIVRGSFTTYQVELGKGRHPKSWQPLAGPREEPVEHGLLCRIDGSALKDGKEWTVRVTAMDRQGRPRVAEVPITL